MVQVVKARLEARIRPSAATIESELLAGRTCPCCGVTLTEIGARIGGRWQAWPLGVAIIHAIRHSICGDTSGGDE